MHSGMSVRPCTIAPPAPSAPTSSASGSPTLTSSMSAPPATCSATSISICERSPACSCAWKALRPVGLIRSPMMQNGLPAPITNGLRLGLQNGVHSSFRRSPASAPAPRISASHSAERSSPPNGNRCSPEIRLAGSRRDWRRRSRRRSRSGFHWRVVASLQQSARLLAQHLQRRADAARHAELEQRRRRGHARAARRSPAAGCRRRGSAARTPGRRRRPARTG